MYTLKLILKIASAKPLLVKAIKIALVVGIILNLINQGDSILSMNFEKINIFKLLLTFCVPFCVSMYTAITMKLKFHVGEKAFCEASLKCKGCGESMSIQQNETIPFCKNCKDSTHWKACLK